ncbi:hypothetical protein N496_03935 [Clostridium botulinum A2B3 87]|uniref:ABC transporter permease n=1 Tax=Clostridium botulinum TaxID=1491 RepID=UPI0004A59192|nr:ABC transporter permease [Clostridium botulinum]KEI98765.1 hypothetical protein N496_03935 [Clostridium botulinum A2B3 87]MBN3346589.1 hypothetical protein [Clostridium botulinum]
MGNNGLGAWFRTALDFIKMDLIQFVRSPASWISCLLTPITMIASFGLGTNVPGISSTLSLGDNYFQFVAPGIMFVGLMFSCTFNMGFSVLIEKKKKILEDVLSSSVSYSSFILARHFSTLIKGLLQIVIIVVVSALFFDMRIKHIFVLILAIACTSLFFSSVGLILSINTDEVGFSGLTNMFLVPIFYFSGVFFPIKNLKYVGGIFQYLPTALDVSLIRYSFTDMISINITTAVIVSIVVSLLLLVFSSNLLKKSLSK